MADDFDEQMEEGWRKDGQKSGSVSSVVEEETVVTGGLKRSAGVESNTRGKQRPIAWPRDLN
jgi:hypothetical protein